MGPYRLLNCINTGQTSRLWQAYDDRSRRFVAIKTLLDSFRKDSEQVKLLKWEFSVASKLENERVIDIQFYGKERGIPFLVMEWFAAPNWKQRINTGLDSYTNILRDTLVGAAESIAYLNGEGWVHCDIKPDNFLVSDEGKVKLIDFALARKAKGGFAKLISRKSKVQGTASYMSPEQIMGKTVDARSDVYSLACTIFECLTGRPPFTGNTISDLLSKHIRSAPPPLVASNSNITPEMVKLIQMAMAKSPDNRPQSSIDFAKMLHNTRPLRKM